LQPFLPAETRHQFTKAAHQATSSVVAFNRPHEGIVDQRASTVNRKRTRPYPQPNGDEPGGTGVNGRGPTTSGRAARSPRRSPRSSRDDRHQPLTRRHFRTRFTSHRCSSFELMPISRAMSFSSTCAARRSGTCSTMRRRYSVWRRAQ
jgi:hypothetical protein